MFDHKNLLIACATGVIVAAIFFVAAFWTGSHVTDSVTRRHVAAYEACGHAEPQHVVLCIKEVGGN